MARITLDQVAPELRKAVRKMPRMPFGSSWFRRLARWGQRRMRLPEYDGVTVETVETAGLGALIYRPGVRRSRAALMWIHGGGYLIGHPVQDAGLCASMAAELGIVVIAAQYRLAPEHPFPAAINDCAALWQWLLENAASLDIDLARIAVGGESAGGGLAANLVHRIHDEGGHQPVAQWLFCPMLDDRTAARRELDERHHFVWDNRSNAIGWRAYLGMEPGSGNPLPYAVAARRENVSGLPQAWIGAGDIDLFHAEDKAYAGRLQAVGVPVVFTEVAGGPHGFPGWAPDTNLSRDFIAGAQAWLKVALGSE